MPTSWATPGPLAGPQYYTTSFTPGLALSTGATISCVASNGPSKLPAPCLAGLLAVQPCAIYAVAKVKPCQNTSCS